MSVLDETWRVGSKVGRTLYRGNGADDLIGVLDTREAAALASLAPEMYRMLKAIAHDDADHEDPELAALIARAEGR
jgi:hypothetical protein